jgi:O-antigen biosynthesis protein
MSHPLIRATINARVSGDPNLWPTEWFRREFASSLPFRTAVSIGCGPGNLERDLVKQGIVSEITGIDVVAKPLEFATEQAAGQPIRYEKADAYEFLRGRPSHFEAIFFHASLHHFDRVEEIVRLAKKALKPEGLLYVDEYVGPSMSQWNLRRLLPINLAYFRLPLAMRRTKIVRTPINPDDPTEAIASADILPAVERHFRVIARRDYGGNLLSIIYPNLNKNAPRFDEGIRRLIAMEDRLLESGAPTFHTVIVAAQSDRRMP